MATQKKIQSKKSAPKAASKSLKKLSPTVRKSAPKSAAKKAAPAKKALPAKKVAPAKKVPPAKKTALAKKQVPALKKAAAKQPVPTKKTAPVKKQVPAKKPAPKKSAPAAKKPASKKPASAKKPGAKPIAKKPAPAKKLDPDVKKAAISAERAERLRYKNGKELQSEPPAGTPLKCALVGGIGAHSGVYLGRGRVAELAGDGDMLAVSLSDFLNGNIGESSPTKIRTGFRIYAACDKKSGLPLGSKEVAEEAWKRTLGSPKQGHWDYDIRNNNCHRFTALCIGDDDDGGWTLSRLEKVIRYYINNGREMTWRAVDPVTPGFHYDATPGKYRQRQILEAIGEGVETGVLAAVAAEVAGEVTVALSNTFTTYKT